MTSRPLARRGRPTLTGESDLRQRGRLARLRHSLPAGKTLPHDAWRQRHRALLALLWAHAIGLPLFALAQGYGVVHSGQEGLIVAGIAALATFAGRRRRTAAALVSLGLVTSSALLVHLWGGVIEAHFHFFVMIVLLSLYEDWLPFLLAAAYVVVHHGVGGALSPADVYNHREAIAHPWKWAAIHGGFVTAAGLGSIAAWRLNEEVRGRERRAYEQARRSEERFRNLLEAAPDAMVILDEAGQIVLVNAQTENLYGYSREELVGREVELLVPKRFRAGEVRRGDGFFGQPTTRPMGTGVEHYALRKDGTELPVEISLAPFETEDGTLVSAAVRDVTERRRAEEASRRLASIVEHSEDAILAKTPEGVITDWNHGAERLYGYSAQEAVGGPVDLIIPPERAGEQGELLARAFAGVAVEDYETVRVRKDGRRVDVSLSVSPIRDASGAVVAASAITRDITERKRAERELERSNAELERFAYVASHDLSEPLRVIAGFVDLLARRYEGQLDEEADKFIRFTVEGTERMQALIDDLLDYSRVGRADLNPTDVDTAALVDGVIGELAGPIAERGTHVEVAELPIVGAEPNLLRQVFQNLIANAVKFSDGERPQVRVSASNGGGQWRFEVEDNGPGVDPRHAERIFQMFQRLHGREVPGTGIGLAIVKRVVERHGGDVSVRAAPDGGSVFSFTIPTAGTTA